MNEQLQDVLASMLQKSMELAEKTGQWMLDIAPELIHQFLMWELWSSLFWISIAIFFIYSPKMVYKLLVKIEINEYPTRYENKKPSLDDIGEGFAFVIIAGIFAIVGFFIGLVNIHKMIHILVAPEIYLIKQFL